MIDIRCILPVVLLGVCKSESVGQFTRYRKFKTVVPQNISASTIMTTIVGCDHFYSTRSTRAIAYDATQQLCHLYEENTFPLIILPDPSPPRTVYVKGTSYMLVQTLMTWLDAKLNCDVNGGHLIKIESAEKSMLIMSWLQFYGRNPNPSSDDGPWIGLNDQAEEGLFSWADGSSPDKFTHWAYKSPDDFGGEDCVHTVYESLEWNDSSCSNQLWSICEFD